MAQTNWQKTMKNVTLSGEDRRSKVRHSRDRWSFTIDIPWEDRSRYYHGFLSELNYFNNLVRAFTSRVKSAPETITGLSEEYERLFGDVAWTQTRLGPFINKRNPELPERMKQYEKLLTKVVANGDRMMNEQLVFFLEEVATFGAGVHPLTRKNMVIEMIRFHKEQAKIYLQGVPKYQQEEMAFRTAPQMLEVSDSNRKRHMQLLICRRFCSGNRLNPYPDI